jgi:hypothetical protein
MDDVQDKHRAAAIVGSTASPTARLTGKAATELVVFWDEIRYDSWQHSRAPLGAEHVWGGLDTSKSAPMATVRDITADLPMF